MKEMTLDNIEYSRPVSLGEYVKSTVGKLTEKLASERDPEKKQQLTARINALNCYYKGGEKSEE